VGSVDAEIEQDLLYLHLVSPYHRLRVGIPGFESHHLVKGVLAYVKHILHNDIEVDGTRTRPPSCSKGSGAV
jgi:hypothetical protein